MTDDLRPEDRPGLEKDPEDWVSGGEPMTGAQASYLETLVRQTGTITRRTPRHRRFAARPTVDGS